MIRIHKLTYQDKGARSCHSISNQVHNPFSECSMIIQIFYSDEGILGFIKNKTKRGDYFPTFLWNHDKGPIFITYWISGSQLAGNQSMYLCDVDIGSQLAGNQLQHLCDVDIGLPVSSRPIRVSVWCRYRAPSWQVTNQSICVM